MVGIERGELPLVLLLRGGSTRSFLVGRGPHDEATVRRLLREGGNSAALRFEYTGMWGLPARLWRRLGDALPFLPLHLLDFLPCAARPRRVLATLARHAPPLPANRHAPRHTHHGTSTIWLTPRRVSPQALLAGRARCPARVWRTHRADWERAAAR